MILPESLFAELRPAYPDTDDRAWRLPSREAPISLTDEEGRALYHAIVARGLRCGYEVATGFGLSSLWAGAALAVTGGDLVSIDCYQEETTQDYAAPPAAGVVWEPRGLVFAMTWRDRLKLPVRYAIGRSPDDVSAVLAGRRLDFALIDGYHFGPQPLIDTLAVLPYLGPRGTLAFHDCQAPAVAQALEAARQRTGGTVRALPTRHALTLIDWGNA